MSDLDILWQEAAAEMRNQPALILFDPTISDNSLQWATHSREGARGILLMPKSLYDLAEYLISVDAEPETDELT